jgi:hypothetical protein
MTHLFHPQARAMRKGFEEVVPLSYLSLFRWYEVETLVCGSPTIDIEVLRKHTTYKGGYSASHIVVRWLFRALTSFNEDERRLFLRCVARRTCGCRWCACPHSGGVACVCCSDSCGAAIACR